MKTKIIILFLLALAGFSTAQTQGTLTISTLTSQTTGAQYAPNNIVAIWIVNNSGAFVKSTLVYAATRQQYLLTWIANSAQNKVDAITGATQTSHGTRTSSWNGKNVSEVVVPDGTYSVKMELTDKNAQGNVGTFAFTKGPAAQTLTPASVPSFANISIKWTPLATGLENTPFSSLYNVYPNPTNSTIFVDGVDIQGIDIRTIAGEYVLTSNTQNIDLSPLPKGIYLAVIRANGGTAVKKIEKQ